MSYNIATAASSSMSKQPTLVYASDFKLPAYLEHSAFYDQFYVASNPAASASSSASVSSSSTALPAGAKGKQREQQQPFASTSHGQATSGTQSRQKRRIPLPCRLDQEQCCKRLLISNDFGLQFMPERDDQGREKVNVRDPDKDAASVRADAPIPPQTGVYYYEVEIISRGQKGYIGIGFTTRAVNLERLPGWNPESYGYHGDDGKAFACTGSGQNYGPRFGSGDIIGCGIDFTLRKAFFVKNGIWLGYIFDLSYPLSYANKGNNTNNTRSGNAQRANRADTATSSGNEPLLFYPTIGLQTIGETVKVNFGQAPFKFDINGFVKRRKQEQTDAILSTPIPRNLTQALSSISSSAKTFHTSPGSVLDSVAANGSSNNAVATEEQVHTSVAELVAGYLSHRGYSDTLRALRQQQSIEKEAYNELLRPSTTSIDSANPDQTESIPAKASTSTGKLKKSKIGKATSGKTSGKVSKNGASALKNTGDIDFGSTAADTSAIMGGEDDSMMVSENAAAGEPDMAGAVTATSHALTAEEIREAELNKLLIEAAWEGIDAPSIVSRNILSSKNTEDARKEQEEQEHQDLLQRQKICSAVRTGNIDIALCELQTSYPGVLRPSSSTTTSSSSAEIANGSSETDSVKVDLLFRLRCQKFVELVLASHSGSMSSPASTASANGDEQDMDMDRNEEGDDDESDVEEDEEIASALIPSRRSASVKETNDARSPKDTPASISMEDVLSYGAELNALYASPPSTTHASSVLFNGEASTQTKQQSQALRDHLSLVFSLVAYSDLNDLKGKVGEICSQDAREILAEDVNSAMLVSKGYPANPVLETLFRQSQAVRTVVGDAFHEGRAALVGDIV